MTIKPSNCIIMFSLMLLSCGDKSGKAIEKKLDGINGSTIYYFDDSDNLIMVQKEEYYKNSKFHVMIKKDSLRLGEEFTGLFFVKPNYRISISEPEIRKMERDSMGSLPSFKYTAKTEGLFNFKGTIEYDTTVVSFEYKFIVMPKD